MYPSLIRKSEPKPIRVYLADTSGDLDNRFGDWPLANQQMLSALKYMGYDVRLDWAEGYSHGPDFGSFHFADAMRWLWRNEIHSPAIHTADDLKGDLTLLNLLVPTEGWEVAAANLGFVDGFCADDDGNFYYCDMRAPAIYRIDADSNETTVVATQSASGLDFGPDGELYGCHGNQKRVFRIDVSNGEVTTVAENVNPNDLSVSEDGYLFITETASKNVTRVDLQSGESSVVDTGIGRPNGIALSNDGGTLAVSDHGGEFTWTFRVGVDGKLDAKMPTMEMRLAIDGDGEFEFNEPPPYVAAAHGDGMTVDRIGRYYVTSDLGVQIFDPTGRMCGVLPTPDPDKPLTSCAMAGVDGDILYVANGSTVYRRRLNVD